MTTPEQKTKVVNKARPEVKVTLGGKERTMVFDLNAMAAFEEATGKGLLDGSFKSSDMTSGHLRTMLWACLISEDGALTREQVGSWVTMENILEITSKLNEVFEVAMPESEDKKAVPLVKSSQTG